MPCIFRHAPLFTCSPVTQMSREQSLCHLLSPPPHRQMHATSWHCTISSCLPTCDKSLAPEGAATGSGDWLPKEATQPLLGAELAWAPCLKLAFSACATPMQVAGHPMGFAVVLLRDEAAGSSMSSCMGKQRGMPSTARYFAGLRHHAAASLHVTLRIPWTRPLPQPVEQVVSQTTSQHATARQYRISGRSRRF